MKILLNTKYSVVKHSRIFFLTSLALIGISVAVLVGKGLNYGIDFNGGLLIEVIIKDKVGIADLRKKLSSIKNLDISLQEFGGARDILIRANIDGYTADEAKNLIQQKIKHDVVEYRRTEFVGPVVGKELKKSAVFAILYALCAMMIYIWFRFEWQYGVAALIALFHDIFLTVGFLAVMGTEFGLSAIAAILTIAGYSINDTVVIFDRIRENFGLHSKKTYGDVYDLSLNQSLSRTVMTSFTTLLALLSLYIFGGAVIQGFTLAMIFGIVIGTYSSNCIATPLLLWLKPSRDRDVFVDPVKELQRQSQ